MSSNGRLLSYGDLDQRAADIATHLAGAGVGRGHLVGVCLERSPDLIAALLGVLKAGAAYLPLDPAYPSTRLAGIAEDAAPRVMLAQRSVAELLPLSLPVIWLDETFGPAPLGAPPLATPLGPDDLAYVIYTSGSTGTPKGVAIEHGNVLWLFDSTRPLFGYDEHDVWSLFHSYGFDFSVWEVFGALLHGGRIAITPHWVGRQADSFLDFLEREQVTMLSQTPSAFWPLVDADDGRPLALKWVVFGGEALDVRRLRPWFSRRGDHHPTLVNMYGITETTVHVTYRLLTAADVDGPVASPIGAALPRVTTRVVDGNGHAVAAGTPGELWVGGPGVARGYLRRPELTAQRFVAPGDASGDRFYRSGDVVVASATGELEYQGRADDQVKIRGFRIELGEIEAVLRLHPSVRDAVVLARPVKDDLQLVAWLVVPHGVADDASVRAHVEARLPEYMRPAHYAHIADIPLTANGKVDRDRLPAPARVSVGRAPSTPMEVAIAAWFHAVLAVPDVTADDNFFHLGGHSLAAARLAARVRTDTGRALSVRDVFATPTVATLAARLESLPPSPAHAPEGSPPPSPPSVALNDAQQRLWLIEKGVPPSAAYTVPVAILLEGDVSPDALRRALNALIERHAALRTSVEDTPRGLVQRVHPRKDVPIDTPDWRDLDVDDAGQLAERLDALAAVPLALEGVLTRAHLCGLRNGWVVMLLAHHVVVDGASVDIITNDLATLYTAETSTTPTHPPPGTAITVDQMHLREDPAAPTPEALAWWARTLEGAPSILELPSDFVRPHHASSAGRVVRRRVSANVVTALTSLGHVHGATLFMTMLAAFQALLHRLARRSDFLVGTPTANRPAFAEHLVGSFVNIVPIRARIANHWRFVDLLEHARDACLDAYDRDDVPFNRIVEHSNPNRRADRMPLVQVVFAYQATPSASRHWGPGVREHRVDVHTGTSKFDVTLLVWPRPNGAVDLEWEFATAVYSVDSQTRALDAYLALLTAAAERPLEPLVSLVGAVGPSDALPPIDASRSVRERESHAPPSDVTERRLADIWRTVLGLRTVTGSDNFFSLGGHSLTAATMLHLASDAFGVDIALPHLYDAPTLRALARQIDAATTAGVAPDRIVARPRQGNPRAR